MSSPRIRNVAIIAHVDHGKTTLVDQLLYQSGMFRNEDLDKLAGGQHNLIMDSNPLERERGITILSKNCAVQYTADDGRTYKINLIDTPGHADFGGEVERVLKLADGVLLVVDAFEGPMPQTRFVLSKALEHGLKPVVVVNKVDRPDARPDAVIDEVFDLLAELEAHDDALDFPAIFASAKDGWATLDHENRSKDLRCIFESIITHVPSPKVNQATDGLQMLITTLDYSDYVGKIGIGRVFSGTLNTGASVNVIKRDGSTSKQRVVQINAFEGLGRKIVNSVIAGDICAVSGIEAIDIGDTLADIDNPVALPSVAIDEPTLNMTFRVNDSPFAGKEGKFVTSRQIKDRLDKELQSNVALRVEPGQSAEEFLVSGRGLMHLGVLLENMRREGFELNVGKPNVIYHQVDGKQHEPIERLEVDCPEECQSAVMGLIGDRRAELVKMENKHGMSGYVHLAFSIPARGLIGLRSRMLTATQGRAILHHTFEKYDVMRGPIPQRSAGVIIATETGQVTAYSLDALFDRGFFFVEPGEQTYEGQVVGEHCKENDIVANISKGKAHSNMRAAGKDDATRVRPKVDLSLEAALEYIQDDELVELTPTSLRLRKRTLKEADRRRQTRRLAKV